MSSGVNVLRELEELRSILDTPLKTFSVDSRWAEPESPAVVRAPGYQSYALNYAEKSVDRLGRAIEAAEDEMEATLKRTTDIHKSHLRQKELELTEQQKLLQAKERSIESLRDTLVTTKRSYESRLSQVEAALAVKDAEATAALEELREARDQLEAMQIRLKQVLTSHSLELNEAKQQASSQARSEESVRAMAQLRSERDQRSAAQREAEDLRRQRDLQAEELRFIKGDAKTARERYEFEIDDLKKRLRSERSIRKGCEKWLRAELKSRDEYDMLLSAIRETANGQPPATENPVLRPSLVPSSGGTLGALPSPLKAIPGAATEIQEVERMLANLKSGKTAVTTSIGSSWPQENHHPHQPAVVTNVSQVPLRTEAEATRRAIEEDNRSLKAELLAARRLLQERVLGGR